MDRLTGGWMDGLTAVLDQWRVGWMDGWTDRWNDGGMNRWTV